MFSDWLIDVIQVAENCPTGIYGGFLTFPNGLHEIMLDDVPGSRGTGVRSHQYMSSLQEFFKNNNTIFAPASDSEFSGATPGARVVPSQYVYNFNSYIRCKHATS